MENKMRIKRKLFAISLFIPFISIFLFPISKIDNHTYAIGFPLRFIWYRSYEKMLENRIQLFYPKNFINTEFNVMYFSISVLVTYVILLVFIKIIKKG